MRLFQKERYFNLFYASLLTGRAVICNHINLASYLVMTGKSCSTSSHKMVDSVLNSLTEYIQEMQDQKRLFHSKIMMVFKQQAFSLKEASRCLFKNAIP